MAAITSDIAALFALLDEARIQDLNMHGSPAFYKLQFGTSFRALLDVVKILDDSFDSISGTPPNWGAGVANIAALKLVTAANRADKQSRVVEDNGLGGESIYIYDLQSTATADDVNVVTPTDDSTGRWLLAYQNGTLQLPVINKTGGPLTKGTPCYISGWDVTAGKLKVAAADAADGTKAANGILGANLADNAQGVLLCGETTISSLDTSGASAADTPVYLKSGGGLAYTAPTTGYVQEIGVVMVKHGSTGKIRVNIKPMRLPPTATDTGVGAGNAGKTVVLDAQGKLDGVVIEDGAGLIKDTDGTMAADSDLRVPTQKAVNTLVKASKAGRLAAAPAAAADTVSSAAGVVNTAFATKYTIPAGKLKVGDVLRMRAAGTVSVSGGGVNCQLTLRVGGVTVGAATAALAVAAADTWLLDADAAFGAVGAGGKFNSLMRSIIGHEGIGTVKNAYVSTQESALDTTADRDVDILVHFDAGAGVTIDLTAFNVELIALQS